MPDTICWNLKAILEKRNSPTHQNDDPQTRGLIAQVPVPRERHKNIRYGQQRNWHCIFEHEATAYSLLFVPAEILAALAAPAH